MYRRWLCLTTMFDRMVSGEITNRLGCLGLRHTFLHDASACLVHVVVRNLCPRLSHVYWKRLFSNVALLLFDMCFCDFKYNLNADE